MKDFFLYAILFFGGKFLRIRKDFTGVVYKRAVDLCLQKHPDLFYKILRNGKGKNRSGPPCDSCRFQASREKARQLKKKTQPWLRKPRHLPLLDNM